MLSALLSMDDMAGQANLKRRAELEQKIDNVLDEGDFDIFEPYFDMAVRDDIDPAALMKFSGYIVRRVKNGSIAKSCSDCSDTLRAPDDRVRHEDEDIIHYLSHRYLIVPSDAVMNIIYRCETAILNILEKEGIDERVLFRGKRSTKEEC